MPLGRCMKCVRSENKISSFDCRQRLQFTDKRKADRVEPQPNVKKKHFFSYIFGLASFIKIKFLVINLY